VFDRLTPQVLELALGRLGLFAAQFRNLDGDATKALVRFILTAANSGDASAYLKSRLAVVEAHDRGLEREPEREPPIEGKARVTSPPGGVRS
jgi:hypothetical protein